MTTFTVPASREPVTYVDKNGKTAFTRPWFLFFQGLFDRVGGATGSGIDDISESLDDGDTDAQAAAAIYALQDEVRSQPFAQTPVAADSVNVEIAGLRDELAELRKTIEGLQQGTSL